MLNLDKILPLVQRPARYINHELNSHKPDMANDVSVCLCFPDIYEVGASNLGIEILYHMVNEKRLARCERAYALDTDFEKILSEQKIPLFSLESKSALNSFDIVGFSLQCELVGTNIINMLFLSGIPVFSKDRQDGDPIIIGGGPGVANPEPFAGFFDLFVIGDGEEILEKIIDIYRKCKHNKTSRQNILFELAKLEGIYVPAFYDVQYKSDGTVKEINANKDNVNKTVNKTVVNLDKAFFHKNKIVPFVETVHNRLNIEVARGCIGQCRFCQAAKYYRPWRTRSVDKILDLVNDGLKSTGYQDVAFSSLSCTDYKDLEDLLLQTNGKYSGQNLNISLPSMRCNKFSLKVAEYINRAKRPTITFAPEAGSDRLRNVIGKYLSETDIEETLLTANLMGWKTIKLYFMIGLPTETEDDITAIKNLIDKIRINSKGLNFNITISPFVPKAHTAFQWEPMFSAQYIKDTIKKIKDIVPASVKAHNWRASVLESFLARGDRKVSQAIYLAWQKGARFDQWSDKLNFDLWQECIRDAGLDIDFYVYRKRDKDEILPWNHINLGVDNDSLYKEYIKGVNETADPHNASARGLKLPENYSEPQKTVSETVSRVLLKFSRSNDVKYLSHLEQIDCLRRAVKRSGLHAAYTAGFSPQIKASFGPAVSVGYESDCEYTDLYLTDIPDINEIRESISKVLPYGYELKEVKYMPVKFPAVDTLVNVSEYMVKGVNISDNDIEKFLNQKEIFVSKVKKGKETVIDIRPLILNIKKTEGDTIKILLRFGMQKSVKLEKILMRMLDMQENDVKILYTKRMRLLIENKSELYEI